MSELERKQTSEEGVEFKQAVVGLMKTYEHDKDVSNSELFAMLVQLVGECIAVMEAAGLPVHEGEAIMNANLAVGVSNARDSLRGLSEPQGNA